MKTQVRERLIWSAGAGLLVATGWFGLRVILESGAVLASGFRVFLPAVLLSWQSALLVTLLVAVVTLNGRSEHLPSLRRLKGDLRRWAVVLLLLAMTMFMRRRAVSINSFGLIADPPHHTFWMDQGHPQRPPVRVTSNQYGYRDTDWTLHAATGTTRVLIVGDSFVYGVGVPDDAGLVHRQLARELRSIAPETTWEVLNGGRPGWSHLSYFEAARRMLHEVRPTVIVVGSLGSSDWDVFDYQQQLELFGSPLFRLAGALGVVTDLNELGVLHDVRACGPSLACPRLGESKVEDRLNRLLSDSSTLGTHIILWEYYTPLPFFDRFKQANFHRLTWPAGFERWPDDPALAIPIDRHPTAAANAIVASRLAPALLGVLMPAADRTGP